MAAIALAQAHARAMDCGRSFLSFVSERIDAKDRKLVERNEFLYREHRVDGASYHEVLVVEDFDSSYGLLTRVVHREVRRGAAPDRLKNATVKRPEHLEFAQRIVNRNVEIYESRTDWDEKQRQAFRDMADEYLEASIYAEVYDKESGARLAGKRYILSPYGIRNGKVVAEGYFVEKNFGPVKGFLEKGERQDPNQLPKPPRWIPEAYGLDIELPRPAVRVPGDESGVATGMHIEMGTLFIEKKLPDGRDIPPELRARIWAEMHLQDLRVAFAEPSDELNSRAKTMHAYADPPHRRMYTDLWGWGWDLLRNYRHAGREISFTNDKQAPTIPKGGTVWVPIIFHPERLEGFHTRFQLGLIPRFGSLDLGERQGQLGEALNGADMIESIDRLVAGYQTLDPRLAPTSAIGLVRMAYRYHWLQKKMQEASRDSSSGWKVPREATALADVPARIEQLIRHSLRPGSTKEEKLLVLMLAGGLAEGKLSPHPLSRDVLFRSVFLPLMRDPDFGVRWTACAYARMFYSARELKVAVPNRNVPKPSIDAELWHRRFENPFLADMSRSLENIVLGGRRDTMVFLRAPGQIWSRVKHLEPELLKPLFQNGILMRPRPPRRDERDKAKYPGAELDRITRIGKLEETLAELEEAKRVSINMLAYVDSELLAPLESMMILADRELASLTAAGRDADARSVAIVKAERRTLEAAREYIKTRIDAQEQHDAIIAKGRVKNGEEIVPDVVRYERTMAKALHLMAAYAAERSTAARLLGEMIPANELHRLARSTAASARQNMAKADEMEIAHAIEMLELASKPIPLELKALHDQAKQEARRLYDEMVRMDAEMNEERENDLRAVQTELAAARGK